MRCLNELFTFKRGRTLDLMFYDTPEPNDLPLEPIVSNMINLLLI
jgi:hypothetical protein